MCCGEPITAIVIFDLIYMENFDFDAISATIRALQVPVIHILKNVISTLQDTLNYQKKTNSKEYVYVRLGSVKMLSQDHLDEEPFQLPSLKKSSSFEEDEIIKPEVSCAVTLRKVVWL